MEKAPAAALLKRRRQRLCGLRRLGLTGKPGLVQHVLGQNSIATGRIIDQHMGQSMIPTMGFRLENPEYRSILIFLSDALLERTHRYIIFEINCYY